MFRVFDAISSEILKEISLSPLEFSNDELVLEKLEENGIVLDREITKIVQSENGLALKVYSGNQLTLTIEEIF